MEVAGSALRAVTRVLTDPGDLWAQSGGDRRSWRDQAGPRHRPDRGRRVVIEQLWFAPACRRWRLPPSSRRRRGSRMAPASRRPVLSVSASLFCQPRRAAPCGSSTTAHMRARGAVPMRRISSKTASAGHSGSASLSRSLTSPQPRRERGDPADGHQHGDDPYGAPTSIKGGTRALDQPAPAPTEPGAGAFGRPSGLAARGGYWAVVRSRRAAR
jgi:hypothetical protein